MTQICDGVSSFTLHGVDVVQVDREGVRDVTATLIPPPGHDPRELPARLGEALGEVDATPLGVTVFGASDAFPSFGEGLDVPLTWVEDHACAPGRVSGVQVRGLSGAPVETLRLDARVVGTVVREGRTRWCVLGGVGPTDPSARRTLQVEETLLALERALALAQMDLRHLIRTWFYVSDILDWYGDFNGVRSRIYADRGIFQGYVPASTGIGGANPHGTALQAAAVARAPAGGVRAIPSPLQCPARDYGSSFSRAAEVTLAGCRQVLVSGTASIGPGGHTVHAGDVNAQVARTFEVVGAILGSRGLDFGDVTRANAYFKHAEHMEVLGGHLCASGLPPARVVVTGNAVCRDDLLFEMEVDAIRRTDHVEHVDRGIGEG